MTTNAIKPLATNWGPVTDIIAEINRAIASVPPQPFFASWSMFPRDRAITFTLDGRDYAGAHPDFWRKIPAERRSGPAPLFAVEIVDFDLSANAPRLTEFSTALARAMGEA